MNKAELAEKVAQGTDLTRAEANKVLNSFANAVIVTLKKGNRVTIKGFWYIFSNQQISP